MPVSFHTTKEETDLISKIADHAISIDETSNKTDIEMDLAACHCNGTPLDLKKLLSWSTEPPIFAAGSFGHDVFGISHHLNRTTGKLERFHPRCARKEIP